MTNRSFIVPSAWLFAFLLLVILSLQYPLSTTFPIGGDAAYYARRAQISLQVFHTPTESIEAIRSSWYPLSLFIFSTTAVLPTDWPTRFTWAMATAHISVGLLLSLLLYRLNGWPSAVLVMIIWAITTTGINSHFEDGTLAHLISFSFLVLFLERFTAGAKWTALLALIATPLSHPITGLALLASLIIATPALFSTWSSLSKKYQSQLLLLCPFSLFLLLLISFAGKPIFSNNVDISGVAHNPFVNTLVSGFAPFIVMAPFGLLILLKSKQARTTKYLLAILFSLSLLLGGNDLLGIAVWTQRLLPLFIFMVTILAALSLPTVIQYVFKTNYARVLFTFLLITYFFSSAWLDNRQVYRHYENPDNYARIDPNEISAMYWMRDHLRPNSYVTTTNVNRHTEWLPVITSLQWLPVSPDDESLSNPTSDKIDSLTFYKQKYIAFFTKREPITGNVLKYPDQFPLIYSNSAVSVYNVPSASYEP